MDLVQIGKFLSELRRERNLTQEQLGETLGVTNKTVSRWETGVYLPPAENLLALSQLYGVSINELLSGKRLAEEDYKQQAEANLTSALKASPFPLKERIAYFQSKWLREHVGALLVMALILLGFFAAGIFLKSPLLLGLSFLLLLIFHGYRNNAMMAYVEQHAFDGSGQ